MNAAIRAATMVARSVGIKVYGVSRGYRGLIAGQFSELQPHDVRELFREGGTMLHSTRCLQFHDVQARHKARQQLRDAGIDGVIVIGGNGSLNGAMALGDNSEAQGQAPAVVGLPASIDNDIALTSISIGVDTAINTIVEACDKISDTARAHDRTFIVEVMGRDCGYLAMTGGVASGANLVLFPEANRSPQDVVEAAVKTVLSNRGPDNKMGGTLIIKAEGVNVGTQELKSMLEVRLGEELGGEMADVECRVSVLGHMVRGGRPSAFDRLLGSRMANVAVRGLARGQCNQMVAWMPDSALAEQAGAPSPDDPYCWLVDLPFALRETANLVRGTSALARWRAAALSGLEDVFTL